MEVDAIGGVARDEVERDGEGGAKVRLVLER